MAEHAGEEGSERIVLRDAAEGHADLQLGGAGGAEGIFGGAAACGFLVKDRSGVGFAVLTKHILYLLGLIECVRFYFTASAIE
ncbi:MAG: hypothetical protein J6C52_00590 [Clostridia bacterium]|nr:hypothetical protein [Clostridia bacterium]